jgi:hypothetical protein
MPVEQRATRLPNPAQIRNVDFTGTRPQDIPVRSEHMVFPGLDMTKSNPVIGYLEEKNRRRSHKWHGRAPDGEQAGLKNDAWDIWKQQYMPAIRAMRNLGMKEKKIDVWLLKILDAPGYRDTDEP